MLILLGSLAFFVVTGLPIAYGLGLSALVYFIAYHPEIILVIPQRFYSGLDSGSCWPSPCTCSWGR